MGVLIIILIVVVIYYYKVFKPKRINEQEKYDRSEYVEKALRFIEFCELGPNNRKIFVTPDYIGVYLMGDDELGFPIMHYLDPADAQYPAYKEAQQEHVYEEIEKRFGGREGMELYRRLNLDVKLHDGNEEFPIIFMWHHVSGNHDGRLLELEKYAKAIERRYKERYGKELSLSQFLSGW